MVDIVFDQYSVVQKLRQAGQNLKEALVEELIQLFDRAYLGYSQGVRKSSIIFADCDMIYLNSPWSEREVIDYLLFNSFKFSQQKYHSLKEYIADPEYFKVSKVVGNYPP